MLRILPPRRSSMLAAWRLRRQRCALLARGAPLLPGASASLWRFSLAADRTPHTRASGSLTGASRQLPLCADRTPHTRAAGSLSGEVVGHLSRGMWAAGAVLLALFVFGCGPDKPEGPPQSDLHIGAVMMENGARFETAGRAAAAGRWGLAEYQAHEMIELFEDDMPRALLPGECDDALADRMYESLLNDQLPALRDAAHAEDEAAFARAFSTASASCNGCHAGCQVSFVVVPTEPGREVPLIEADRPAVPSAESPAQAEAPAVE